MLVAIGTVEVVLTVVEDDEEPAGVMGAGVAAGCVGGVEPPLSAGAAAGGWSPTTVVRASMIGLLGSIIVKWI